MNGLTGGLPLIAFGCAGVWRVASVTPTTEPAATTATTATAITIWWRDDMSGIQGSRNGAVRYYPLYSDAELQGTSQEDARGDHRDRLHDRARPERQHPLRGRPRARGVGRGSHPRG